MGSPSKMRGGQGVVLACLVAASLGGWEDTGEECSGNTCFDPASNIIRVVRSKTSSTGLKYKERSNDKVSVVDVMAVCLPGVDKAFMASSFKSCEDKKLTSVCTMKERGWLVADGDETVANEAALLSAASGLAGGEEAVRDCLKLPEEVEEYEYEYYYYDYADYGAEWDYLEEAGGQVRQRRDTETKTKKQADRQKERKATRKENGKETKKGRKRVNNGKDGKGKKGVKGKKDGQEKKGNGKKTKREKGSRSSKKNKGKEKGNGNKPKKGSRSSKKKDKKNSGQPKRKQILSKLRSDLKTAKSEAQQLRKEARKAAKEEKELKEAEKEKKEKERKREEKKADLGKLGFKKMPSKSTISRLRCIHTKFSDLMVACAKANLS